jgi:hypothetical protein
MLRSAGFAITVHPEDEVYICRRVAAPEGAGAVYPKSGAKEAGTKVDGAKEARE